MSSEKKVVNLQIIYDDGSWQSASGEAADTIWEWYLNAEALAWVHGAAYKGPNFTHHEAGDWAERGPRERGA